MRGLGHHDLLDLGVCRWVCGVGLSGMGRGRGEGHLRTCVILSMIFILLRWLRRHYFLLVVRSAAGVVQVWVA